MPASKIKRARIRAGQKLHEKIWKRHDPLSLCNAEASMSDVVESLYAIDVALDRDDDCASRGTPLAVTPERSAPPTPTSTFTADATATSTATGTFTSRHPVNTPVNANNSTELGHISPTILSNPPSPLVLHLQAPSSCSIIQASVPASASSPSVSASAPHHYQMKMSAAQGSCPSIISQCHLSPQPAPTSNLTPQRTLQPQVQRYIQSEHMTVDQLSKDSIREFIEKLCDSANDVILERNTALSTGLAGHDVDKLMEGKAWREWQKLEGACRFLDNLLEENIFITLPADCMLDDTRRLLEQLKLADGMRAIAIQLEENKEEEYQMGNGDANKEGAQLPFTHSPRLLMLTRSSTTHLPINHDPVRIILEMLVSTRVMPTAAASSISTTTTSLGGESTDVDENCPALVQEARDTLPPRPEIDLTPLLVHRDQLHASAAAAALHHTQSASTFAARDDMFLPVPSQQPMLEYLDLSQPQQGEPLIPHSYIHPPPFPLFPPPPPSMPFNNESILPAWPFPPPSLPLLGPPAFGPSLPPLPPPPSMLNNHSHAGLPLPMLPFGHFPMHPFERVPHPCVPSHSHQMISPYLDSSPMTSFSTSGTFTSSIPSPLLEQAEQATLIHGRTHSNSASSVITAATSVHEEDLGNISVNLALSTPDSDKTVVTNTRKFFANQSDEERPRQIGQGRETYLPHDNKFSSSVLEFRKNTISSNKQDDKVKAEIKKAISGNLSSSSSFKQPSNRTTFNHHPEQKNLNLITNGRSGQPDMEQRIYGGSSRSLLQPETRCAPPLGVLPFNKMITPPCNRHYLLYHGCPASNCPYSHSYMLTSSELARLRMDSLKSPCTNLKSGYKCFIGEENCHMGHRCPYGRECKYGLMCKFLSIPGTHDGPPINESFARLAAHQEGESTLAVLKNIAVRDVVVEPTSLPVSPVSMSSSESSSGGSSQVKTDSDDGQTKDVPPLPVSSCVRRPRPPLQSVRGTFMITNKLPSCDAKMVGAVSMQMLEPQPRVLRSNDVKLVRPPQLRPLRTKEPFFRTKQAPLSAVASIPFKPEVKPLPSRPFGFQRRCMPVKTVDPGRATQLSEKASARPPPAAMLGPEKRVVTLDGRKQVEGLDR